MLIRQTRFKKGREVENPLELNPKKNIEGVYSYLILITCQQVKKNIKLNNFLKSHILYYITLGCGTWPAYWLCGDNWPNNGEIDIIEGVNTQNFNQMTLHSKANCNMSI